MLKPIFIRAKTLDEAYFLVLKSLWDYGHKTHIDTGSNAGGYRLEGDMVTCFIEYPSTRPLSPIFPEGVDPVCSEDDIEKYFQNYLMNGSNLGPKEHYRYATWITGGKYKLPTSKILIAEYMNDDGITGDVTSFNDDTTIIAPDQLQWCIDHYLAKGLYNNHCYIQIGYPESNSAYDMPYTDETDRQTSPCLRGIDTKILHNKDKNIDELYFHCYFRSWDAYAGLPTNLGGIILLGEYMAAMLGETVKFSGLAFTSIKLHCYDYQLDILKSRLGIE